MAEDKEKLTKEKISEYFLNLQNEICNQLEIADGEAKFIIDEWIRPGGGGGKTKIIQNGKIIEKGGVGFSAVHGKSNPELLKQLNLTEESDFFATGVSIVIHPNNPFMPIIHMNVRYFEMDNGIYWFGGGIDLTPHYVNENDAKYFHNELKKVCDRFDINYYKKFKNWADDYFFIKHRNETRGIGGIFFDGLKEDVQKSKHDIFNFVMGVGESFAPIYVYFMNKNVGLEYSEKEKKWQLIRRGRYAEFNLVWDRGTKFGLESDGRTESILMSLPPQVEWHYNYKAIEGSVEEKTLLLLKKGINWCE